MPEPKRPPLKDWLGEMGACHVVPGNDLAEQWRAARGGDGYWLIGKACDTSATFEGGGKCRCKAAREAKTSPPPLVTDAWDAYCYARWMADHA